MAAVELVVALDGPSGSGKSTVARGVARALGWSYLDTGATYRAATLAVLRARVPLDDHRSVAEVVTAARIAMDTDPDAPRVVLDGADVTKEVRGPEVTTAVSAVSAVPAVRAHLVALQRELIGEGRAVVEGRDICSVVAPDARLKVFLDADPAVRAARRAAEPDAGVAVAGDTSGTSGTDGTERRGGAAGAGSSGPPASGAAPDAAEARTAAVAADLARRDALDRSRAASPLAAAPDAIRVDATHLDAAGVIAEVLRLARTAGLDELS